MSWGLVGSFAVSAVAGQAQASKANTAGLNSYAAGLQDEAAQWTKNAADNKAIAEANLQNTIRTGYKVGLLNVQRAQAKKAAMQQGINLSRSTQQVLGAATANAAAAGQVGNSVDAVVADIYQKVDEAGAQMGADYEQQVENFDTQLYDILNSGKDMLKSAQNISVRKTAEPTQVGTGEVLLGAAVGTGGKWLNDNMTLGLGKPKSTGVSNDIQSPGLTARDVLSAF